MSVYPLMEYAQATADANGRATANVGPQRYGDTWVIRSMTTSSDSTSECKMKVYRGVESTSSLVLGTYSGNQDTAGGTELTIGAQDKLVFVWEGASLGATCTCRIEGDLQSRRM